MPNIEEIEIRNLTTFMDEVNKNHPDKHVYRGLSSESFKLIPSLGRYPHLYSDTSFVWGKFSEQLITEFKNQYEGYSERPLTNDLDYQIVGQHHGLITNLLDWSQNPLAALYFSVEKVKHYESDNSDAIVWSLTDYESYYPNRLMRLPSTKKIIVYFSRHVTKRISAQRGCFSIHILPERNKPFVPLEVDCGDSRLKKYLIRASAKKSIRIQLNNIGVNEHTLFPDLVGLCKQLTWKFTNTNYPQTIHCAKSTD